MTFISKKSGLCWLICQGEGPEFLQWIILGQYSSDKRSRSHLAHSEIDSLLLTPWAALGSLSALRFDSVEKFHINPNPAELTTEHSEHGG
jgi:hypothetical protein